MCGDVHVIHRVTSKYDQLAKVRYVLDKLMGTMHNAWIVGKRITIDEIMINYYGRAVSFIQHMSKKHRKYDIKVLLYVVRTLVICLVLRYIWVKTQR